MGQFVGNGVKDLADRGDHVKVPGNLSVNHVGQAGYGKNGTCDKVITHFRGIEVDDHIHRDQNQTEQAQKVRDGEYFFFPVVYENGFFLREGKR